MSSFGLRFFAGRTCHIVTSMEKLLVAYLSVWAFVLVVDGHSWPELRGM